LALSDASGNLRILISCQPSLNISFITNDTPLAANTWTCVALTVDNTNASAPTGHVYTGTLTASLIERAYGTAQAGAGALEAGGSPVRRGRRVAGHLPGPRLRLRRRRDRGARLARLRGRLLRRRVARVLTLAPPGRSGVASGRWPSR